MFFFFFKLRMNEFGIYELVPEEPAAAGGKAEPIPIRPKPGN